MLKNALGRLLSRSLACLGAGLLGVWVGGYIGSVLGIAGCVVAFVGDQNAVETTIAAASLGAICALILLSAQTGGFTFAFPIGMLVGGLINDLLRAREP